MNTPAEPGKPDESAWGKPSVDLGDSYLMPHPIWNPKWAEAEVKITHEAPMDTVETLAYYCVKLLRLNFDYISGFRFGERTVEKWLVRMVFLETVAAVPGMVSSMLRHFGSLRRMKRDRGFIHTLLEEAENERMHLMVAMKLYKPGPLFRLGVILTQGAFGNFWFLAYVLSPRFCHKFVAIWKRKLSRRTPLCWTTSTRKRFLGGARQRRRLRGCTGNSPIMQRCEMSLCKYALTKRITAL